MTEGLVILIVGIVLAFLFRRFRVSPYGIVEGSSIEHAFRATRAPTLAFSGEAARVIHSDMTLDIHAKGPFTESRVPLRAVKICQNDSGEYFLWTYKRPPGEVRILPLSSEEAPRLLQNKATLLATVFPNEE